MARDRQLRPVIDKKYQISQDEIDKIRQDSADASVLLKSTFLTSYFEQTKQSILELHAKQSIYDVTESREVNGITTTHSIPSKKEYTLLAGEYRFIDKLLGTLEQTVLLAQELEKKIKADEVDIEVPPDE